MQQYRSRKRVSGVEDLPQGEHWAIIGTEGVYIPGDERSRTNPGHGYPASTQYHPTYEAFTDFDEFTHALEAAMLRGDRVRGIHVTDDLYKLKTTIVKAPRA